MTGASVTLKRKRKHEIDIYRVIIRNSKREF